MLSYRITDRAAGRAERPRCRAR